MERRTSKADPTTWLRERANTVVPKQASLALALLVAGIHSFQAIGGRLGRLID